MNNPIGNQVSGFVNVAVFGASKEEIRVIKTILGAIVGIELGIIAMFAVITLFTSAWGMGVFLLLLLAALIHVIYDSDDEPTYRLTDEGAEMRSKRKKYCRSYTWDEVVDVCEILMEYYKGRSRYTIPYIAIMRRPRVELNINIANSREYAAEQYVDIRRNLDIIAIPKTEETVSFISQFKTIQPLPEKYGLEERR